MLFKKFLKVIMPQQHAVKFYYVEQPKYIKASQHTAPTRKLDTQQHMHSDLESPSVEYGTYPSGASSYHYCGYSQYNKQEHTHCFYPKYWQMKICTVKISLGNVNVNMVVAVCVCFWPVCRW